LTVRQDTTNIDRTAFVAPDIPEKEQPRSAPKVIVPLQPIKCNEGQPINFTAKIEGNPTPTVN
jgi:hypothetical protein